MKKNLRSKSPKNGGVYLVFLTLREIKVSEWELSDVRVLRVGRGDLTPPQTQIVGKTKFFDSYLFVSLPRTRRKQQQHREQLQSACEHIENQNELAHRREKAEVAGRAAQ